MCPDRFDHLGVDAQHRIERHHRVLKDHCDLVAAQLLPALLGCADYIFSPKADFATDNTAWVIHQAHD